ncbi:MAG: xylose ABC transporter ATP-binding protein [Alphaproteobacteria bacterium]
MSHLLEMHGIVKDFSGVIALNNVDLTLDKGEVLSLCGENGSGKSTLMKVLSGIWPYGSYKGEILLDGQPQHYNHIKQSENAGIVIIHQELALVNHLTVAENIFLGVEPNKNGVVNWPAMYKRAKELLKKVKLDIAPDTKLGDLGTGQQQLVEIARAIGKNAKILVLDEPSSSLTEKETAILLDIVKDLREQGVACVYISHKLDEVMEISDRVMVIRDGEHIDTKDVGELTKDDIVTMMVGRELNNLFPREEHDIGDVIFKAENFTVYDKANKSMKRVDNASFELKAGEILGFSGLVGAGRTEFMEAIYGSWTGDYSGSIILNGQSVKINSANDALKAKIGLVPEDRKNQGIVAIHSVAKNMTLANLSEYTGMLGKINAAQEMGDVAEGVTKLKVKTPSVETEIKNLSGGNQQKVVLAKFLLINPNILILDEPTRGIDVGAKYEIYKLIFELVKQGVSVIMVSSELPEVLGISDRVVVMSEGKITGIFDNDASLNQETIMQAAIGG